MGTVRLLLPEELKAAVELVWASFLLFEAPVYPREGVENFRNYIDYESMRRRMEEGKIIFAAGFENGRMTGVAAAAPDPVVFNHLSLLFVDEAYHRRGIGRELVEFLAAYCRQRDVSLKELTVHASPYGVGFYERLGFEKTSDEKQTDGIRFTPMTLKL